MVTTSKVKVSFMFCLLILTGCAGAQLGKEWKEKRGYTDQEIAETRTYHEEYVHLLAQARVQSNSFNTTEKVNAENRLKTIWCSCVKKLGPKCQQKPTSLLGDDRVLWAKANAAEMSLTGMKANDNPFDSRRFFLDQAECN